MLCNKNVSPDKQQFQCKVVWRSS